MKKVIAAVLFCFILFSFYIFTDNHFVSVPDIENLDVNSAKTVLIGKGLLPKIEYIYHNDYEQNTIIKTSPAIGCKVAADTPIVLYVCKGPSYYKLPNAIGSMSDIVGINSFSWGENGEIQTKGFLKPFVKEGYLHIPMYLCCTSNYKIEFYDNFGVASTNDTFENSIPIEIQYDLKNVNNGGRQTDFKAIIPLADLGAQKPTNISLKFDFLVNGERETFSANFNLSW